VEKRNDSMKRKYLRANIPENFYGEVYDELFEDELKVAA